MTAISSRVISKYFSPKALPLRKKVSDRSSSSQSADDVEATDVAPESEVTLGPIYVKPSQEKEEKEIFCIPFDAQGQIDLEKVKEFAKKAQEKFDPDVKLRSKTNSQGQKILYVKKPKSQKEQKFSDFKDKLDPSRVKKRRYRETGALGLLTGPLSRGKVVNLKNPYIGGPRTLAFRLAVKDSLTPRELNEILSTGYSELPTDQTEQKNEQETTLSIRCEMLLTAWQAYKKIHPKGQSCSVHEVAQQGFNKFLLNKLPTRLRGEYQYYLQNKYRNILPKDGDLLDLAKAYDSAVNSLNEDLRKIETISKEDARQAHQEKGVQLSPYRKPHKPGRVKRSPAGKFKPVQRRRNLQQAQKTALRNQAKSLQQQGKELEELFPDPDKRDLEIGVSALEHNWAWFKEDLVGQEEKKEKEKYPLSLSTFQDTWKKLEKKAGPAE